MKIIFKSVYVVLFCVSAVVLTSYSRFEPGPVDQEIETIQNDSLPAEVQEIINSSCINCHAPGGRAMAMAKLDFSKWNEYDAEKKARKADAMCGELTKGSMPPKSFLKEHPELVPTTEQVEIICNWAASLNQGE